VGKKPCPPEERWAEGAVRTVGPRLDAQTDCRLVDGSPTSFLRQRDLWCLGCEALEDIRQGRIPVQQKSFLECAGLNPKVSEDGLSRFIHATDIAWTDGSAPLDIIFSAAVRRAWVANAVRQFVEAGGEKVSAAMLTRYQSVKVKRGEGTSLAKMASDAMDLPTFIQKANMLAGTQWAEVIAQYGERMTG